MPQKILPKKILNIQQWFDPLKFAERNAAIQETIILDSLPRFQPLVTESGGKIELDWQFGLLKRHIVVTGRWSARIPMSCQRCLQTVWLDLQQESKLCLLRPEESEEYVPEGFEPIMLEGERIKLAQLLEDELLLALPVAPVHQQCPDNQYQPIAEPEADIPETEAKANPFQILESLKKSH
ncbi:YceD family protein [Candidatus Venteria ishoeyi]|uniref:YceD family protein n=1 Tax=Candidatus Venteria ishoeyi TaxID=1899563 RepID=UPI0025A6605D|nr:YceD family protein [Candidatus Venteria ishoeyi]MDM8547501.1 YceD family protein [Candidatus Venteria ishoeyi]